MNRYVVLSLPSEVAAELTASGLARTLPSDDGRGVGEVVATAVEVINTGGAFVAVAATSSAARRIVTSWLRRRRDGDRVVSLQARLRDRVETTRIDLEASDAVEQLLGFLVRVVAMGEHENRN